MNRSRSLIVPSVMAAATIACFVTACGGGSSATSGQSTHRSVLAYSQCMQAHGIPNFPDPGRNGEIDKNQMIALGRSPQIDRASRACQHLMPSSGLGPPDTGPPSPNRFANLLAFATCVRGHGFPRFPDPTRSGGLTVQMITAAGIDLHQPAVLRAGDACVPASHGAVTRATVARVVSGQ